MKKVVLFFCVLFNLGAAIAMHEYDRYIVIDNGVFWNNKKIEGVDIETFQKLYFKRLNFGIGSSYAKDKNSVYYKGKVIENADVETFEIIDNFGYSKDKNSVYLEGEKFLKVDPNTFEVLDYDYIKDKNSVYFQRKLINKADPVTFKPLDSFFSYYS